MLEAASVVGEVFAAAAVAAGAQDPVEDVEAVCTGLAAQRHFLDDTGWTVWPDATSGGRYRFQHALYQQVLYESLGTARRVQLHQRIGARLEVGYGARVGEIAAQLAVHFEQAGAVQRAVHYWQQTGENAGRRHAYPEALAALRKGLGLLMTLPESPERAQRELTLQLSLGELLIVAKGAPAPEVGEVYGRAHLEHGLFRRDTPPPAAPTFHGGQYYLRVTHLGWMMQLLWELGYTEQAQQRRAEALALAQQSGEPSSLAHAQVFGAILLQYRRDAAATYAGADALTAFATTQGLVHHAAYGRILLGWALARQGDATAGVAHMQQGLDVIHDTGLKLYRPYFLALLAEASGQAGQPEAGLTILAEALALVAATEERWWEAELYRLQGALLLQLPSPDMYQAEACFQQALDVARRQQAKALELRAALSLARLWQRQGKLVAARPLLAEIYRWFTEGFDTVDLQEAKALLEELGGLVPRLPRPCI